MSVAMRIDIDDAAARAGLEAAIARSQDLTPAWDEIGRTVVDHAVLRFARQVDPDGKPWTPLAPSTLKSKARRGRPLQILIDRGRLRGSLTHAADRDGVTIGTNVIYAGIHQRGGEIHHGARSTSLHFDSNGRFASARSAKSRKTITRSISAEIGAHLTKIPARPFLGLDAADREDIPEILGRHVLGGTP